MYNILSHGINHCRGYNSKVIGSVHAELSAIRNLPVRSKNKKIKKVSLLVIKSSKTHCLSLSKPCIKCVNDLTIEPLRYGYRIDRIYYSDNNGYIICRKFADLVNDKDQHISKRFRENGYRGRFV